jgi:hypothetical protein
LYQATQKLRHISIQKVPRCDYFIYYDYSHFVSMLSVLCQTKQNQIIIIRFWSYSGRVFFFYSFFKIINFQNNGLTSEKYILVNLIISFVHAYAFTIRLANVQKMIKLFSFCFYVIVLCQTKLNQIIIIRFWNYSGRVFFFIKCFFIKLAELENELKTLEEGERRTNSVPISSLWA